MKNLLLIFLSLFSLIGYSQYEDNVLQSAGKSPSLECEKRTYNRAILNGGVTQDFTVNIENIREICRKLSYTNGWTFFNEASFVYVPSSYGESKNFAQVQNKRNLLLNSTTGTTQSITTTAQQYTLQLKGTGTYTLSGTFSGSLVGTGVSNLVKLTFTPTAGTLTLTVSGSITEVQLETGAYATPYQKTVAAGDGIVDFNFTRATSSTVTNKQGVIEDSCYNLLVNSATGTTQSVSVANVSHTLTLEGTGTYTLSGAFVGSLMGNGTSRVSLTFTPTAGTLTLTNSGSTTKVQLEKGSTPRPYLRTTNRLNVPRLDYSRGIGEPELLIERQSTNLVLWSEDITKSANWASDNGGIVRSGDVITAPDNTVTADKLVETGTAIQDIAQSFSTTIGRYTYSHYIKAAERYYITLQFAAAGNTNGVRAMFNLNTGAIELPAVLLGSATNPVASIVSVGNGWYRCSISCNLVSNQTTGIVLIMQDTNSSYVSSHTAIAGYGVYLWGAQLEVGSNPTTYIPTTTATVTRNAETSYVDLFNNAALNSTNWTLFWGGYLYDGQTTNMSVCLSDSTTAATNTNQIGWYSTMTPFYNISNTRTNKTAATNGLHRFAIEYNNGTADFWLDGVETSSGNSVPVFDYRYLVLNNGGSTYATDKIALFNRTLSNGELTTLTSP